MKYKNVIEEFPAQWSQLKTILEDSSINKIGYNLKTVMHVLHSCSIELNGLYFDTLLAAYIINPGVKDLSLSTLLIEQGIIDTNLSHNTSKESEDIRNESVINYQGKACGLNYTLYQKLDLELVDKVRDVYFSVEMPLTLVLYKMEQKGVLISLESLHSQKKYLEDRIKALEGEIYDMIGHKFNINSPKQLGTILFDELKLPKQRKNKTGLSTDEKVLNALEHSHPVITKIKEYREVNKLYSTYVIGVEKLVDGSNHLHTSFTQYITSTGRLSSINPNLQNIPVRSDIGKKIREMFIVPKDSYLVSIDYSQIELRFIAYFSQDPTMIDAFKKGNDIHASTAAEIFNVKESDVTPNQRRMAKIINFGIAYGMSEYGLSSQLGIPREEASKVIEQYFATYKGVREYLNKTIIQAENQKYTESLLGRRRYIPSILSPQRSLREHARREAINMPLQGSNADLIKMAMIEIEKQIKYFDVPVHMILQVHDELLFEIETRDETVLKQISEKLADIMSNIIKLDVEIKVDVRYGENWGDLKHV